jgi:hypothetical protein
MEARAMPGSGLTSILLRVPGRLALLFGLGALSATGAGTAATASDAPSARKGNPVIRSDGSSVYLAEDGGGFQPLALADTPEARRLLSLLDRQAGATAGLRLRPTLLAGDGGAGFHWAPERKQVPPKNGTPTKTRNQVPAGRPAAPSDPAAHRGAKG